jgi:hypothetical protein
MSSPWSEGDDAAGRRIRELDGIATTICEILAGLKRPEDISLVVAMVLWQIPDEICLPTVEMVVEEKTKRLKRKQ